MNQFGVFPVQLYNIILYTSEFEEERMSVVTDKFSCRDYYCRFKLIIISARIEYIACIINTIRKYVLLLSHRRLCATMHIIFYYSLYYIIISYYDLNIIVYHYDNTLLITTVMSSPRLYKNKYWRLSISVIILKHFSTQCPCIPTI